MRRLRITLMFFVLNRLPKGRVKDRYFKWAMKDRTFRLICSYRLALIAGWIRYTRRAMNNIPAFVEWLQTKLPEMLNGAT